MKKIKTIIADNEPLALQQLEKFLGEEDEIKLVASCRNGQTVLDAINEHHPALVFLDIEMPELNGIEVMETLGGEHLPFVVFVTAFDEYAVKAFEVNALDYLLKPFNKKRFSETLERAKNHISQFSKANGNQIEPKRTGRKEYLSRLLVKTSKKMFFVNIENIEWIESSGNYAKIVTSKDSHLIRSTLKYLEERLDPQKFVRVHKSTIVNISRIKELKQWFTGDYEILLKNGEKLKMSRNYREVLERFK
jgi:two-component system LytT family response regulator